MSFANTIVLKFGGSVLADEASIAIAVHEIYRYRRNGFNVVAVVSAVGSTTDALLAKAREICDEPDPYALAALLSTGESTSAALLALGLWKAGVPSIVLDAARAGIRTEGPPLDSDPVHLDKSAFEKAFAVAPVIVVPGFVGLDSFDRVTLLGRGGSDLTALFIAHKIGAVACRLVKDVNGFYEKDPALFGPAPRRFGRIGYDRAISLRSGLVQDKALLFAKRHGLQFEVASVQSDVPTAVGPGESCFIPDIKPDRPTRVLLLGLGTVGLGVYRRLRSQPSKFEVVGALVRDPSKKRGEDFPPEIVFTDPWDVLTLACDVVVEALGGSEPATALVGTALDLGIDVVTANKEIVALHGHDFEGRASASGARFLYSACVGGAIPVIENLGRIAAQVGVKSVQGIVNGTTNFILDRVRSGATYEEALAEAQQRGLAEPDPTADVCGTDAAWKASILARVGLGENVAPDAVERVGIDKLDSDAVRKSAAVGKVTKLVASCEKTGDGVAIRVRPTELPKDHPLAGVIAEGNRILIETSSGEIVVLDGKGAGRWPTAEAVLGDILDIFRGRERKREASIVPVQADSSPTQGLLDLPEGHSPACACGNALNVRGQA